MRVRKIEFNISEHTYRIVILSIDNFIPPCVIRCAKLSAMQKEISFSWNRNRVQNANENYE